MDTRSTPAGSSLQISPPLDEDRSSPPSSLIGSHSAPLEGSPTIPPVLSPIILLEDSPALLLSPENVLGIETLFLIDVLAPCPSVSYTLPNAPLVTCSLDNSSTEILSSSSEGFSPSRGTVTGLREDIPLLESGHGEITPTFLPSSSLHLRDLQILNKEELQP